MNTLSYQRYITSKEDPQYILRRILAAIFFLLIIFVLAEIGYHGFIAPRLRIRRVIIEGDSELGAAEIMRLANIPMNTYYDKIDVAAIETTLHQHASIKFARLERQFPDTLRFNITMRTPLAVGLVAYETGTRAFVVDQEGVVIAIDPSSIDSSLPILSDLPIESVALGDQLPETLLPLLRKLQHLRASDHDLFHQISEIAIVNNYAEQYELEVYFLSYPSPVIASEMFDADRGNYAMLVLDTLRQTNKIESVEAIDIRGDIIVYQLRDTDR